MKKQKKRSSRSKTKKKIRRLRRMEHRKPIEGIPDENDTEEGRPKNAKFINKMVFNFYEKNGSPGVNFVSVTGVPVNLKVAIQQIHSAMEAVVKLFVDRAIAGNLDRNYNIVDSPVRIKPPVGELLVKDRRLVTPSGIVIPGSKESGGKII